MKRYKSIAIGLVLAGIMAFGIVVHARNWLDAWVIHYDSWDLWVFMVVALAGGAGAVVWCWVSVPKGYLRLAILLGCSGICIAGILLPILLRSRDEGVVVSKGYMGRWQARSDSPATWLEMLHSDSKTVRGEALDHLVLMGKDAVPGLLRLLKDQKETTRWTAAIGLRAIAERQPECMADSGTVGTLTAALADASASVRLNMGRVLARLGTAARPAIPQLEQLANSDPEGKVRIAAHYCLARLGEDPNARVGEIIRESKDAESTIDRGTACECLRDLYGNSGIAEDIIVQALIDALSDMAPEVRHIAQRSLQRISGMDYGSDKTRWKEWQRRRTSQSRE